MPKHPPPPAAPRDDTSSAPDAATSAAPAMVPIPRIKPYRPITARRKVLIVLLTLSTVGVIAVEMLKPHMHLMNAKAARAEAAARIACPPGAASVAAGCPGSTMQVLILPAGAAPGSR